MLPCDEVEKVAPMVGYEESQIVCPKRQMQWRNSFPEEIIFEILLRLPAHVLYHVMRYVCHQWCRIIEGPQFVSTHFQLASSNLLVCSYRRRLCRLLDIRESHAKFSGFEFQIPSKCIVHACNGLILVRKWSRLPNSTNYVGNPITRTLLALPQLPFPIVVGGIAFEASFKVYKVIVVYSREQVKLDLGCAILTVGIDEAWRFIDCASLKKMDMRLLNKTPITCTDFVYWAAISHPYMLALDLKSESMKHISLPFSSEALRDLNFFAKGNSISVWYPKSDCSMEVWLLKDYISEEWVKFLCIDGKPIRNEVCKVMSLDELASSRNFRYIIPRRWLENGEKILLSGAFCTSAILFVYDLKTGGCCPFDVEHQGSFNCLLEPFVNSLTWIS